MVVMDKLTGRGWKHKVRTVAPMVVMILIVAACSSSDDDAVTTGAPASTTTQATPRTTTPIATTSSTVAPTSSLEAQQEALAVAEAHIAAFNAGDRDAVMGSFTPDVSISDSFKGEWIVTDWEMALAWDIAQGSILTAADCTVAGESSPGAVTVTCESGSHHAPSQAIGAPPVPTTLTFLVVPEGISELELIYGEPDFLHTGTPLMRWVQGSHPEDMDRVGFGVWSSVEEAEENGRLFAQYAEEWAAFLDASDCVYPDICFRILIVG